MLNICFVCHGNICRSPMAEFIFKDMVAARGLADQFTIVSRATSTEELGNPVYPPAKAELAKHGIGCKGKRAIQLKRSDYDAYDFLIGMDAMNMYNMERITGKRRGGKMEMLLAYAGQERDVRDPWYTRHFDETYADVTLGCEAFLAYLEARGDILCQG